MAIVRKWLRDKTGFSLGKHWHCPNCQQHWRLYRQCAQHVWTERMPCRRVA